jgi:hypothetical protein
VGTGRDARYVNALAVNAVRFLQLFHQAE